MLSKGGIDTKGLKYHRKKAGLTQRDIAEALGVDRTAVVKWEAGEAYPRASQLPALADALHCSIDELYEPPETESA